MQAETPFLQKVTPSRVLRTKRALKGVVRPQFLAWRRGNVWSTKILFKILYHSLQVKSCSDTEQGAVLHALDPTSRSEFLNPWPIIMRPHTLSYALLRPRPHGADGSEQWSQAKPSRATRSTVIVYPVPAGGCLIACRFLLGMFTVQE